LSNSIRIFIAAKALHILQWLFKHSEKERKEKEWRTNKPHLVREGRQFDSYRFIKSPVQPVNANRQAGKLKFIKRMNS